MAARKRRTTDKPQPDKPDKLPQNGVAVLIGPADDKGESGIFVQALGDTRMTEAPTLLERGVQIARQQLGLPERG